MPAPMSAPMSAPMRVLAVTGGHRVDHEAFEGMLAALAAERGWTLTFAEQPDVQARFAPGLQDDVDAVLCHDIPGLTLQRGTAPSVVGPDEQTRRNLLDLLDAGIGLVFLHHALAGWPGWGQWADVLGGRYHYAPGELRGEPWPDSGYRHTRFTVQPVAQHPVTAGIPAFTLDDELYCCPVFADDVVPLLRVGDPGPGEFRGTLHEVLGTPGPPWRHPPASDLIGWAKTAGTSPVVYLQPGDGPGTFAHPPFRRLLGNALDWVGSPAARAWAASHPTSLHPTTNPR